MESEPIRPAVERGDSVMPNESASHRGDDAHSEVLPSVEVHEELPFPFKFKAPSGRVHRVQVVAVNGIAELVANVTSKLGSELEAVGGEAIVTDGQLGKEGFAMSYMDNEGDTVSVTTDPGFAGCDRNGSARQERQGRSLRARSRAPSDDCNN